MQSQATMICVDNSEWMRNGDYCPSRFAQQSDAVAIICNAKLQVSLLSLARACVSPPQAVTLLFARVLAFSGAASDGFVLGGGGFGPLRRTGRARWGCWPWRAGASA